MVQVFHTIFFRVSLVENVLNFQIILHKNDEWSEQHIFKTEGYNGIHVILCAVTLFYEILTSGNMPFMAPRNL